jgi:hypothetical protein
MKDIAAPKPFPLGAVSGWASSSSNGMLHFVFDSDGDTDPDPDACGKGSRPGS